MLIRFTISSYVYSTTYTQACKSCAGIFLQYAQEIVGQDKCVLCAMFASDESLVNNTMSAYPIMCKLPQPASLDMISKFLANHSTSVTFGFDSLFVMQVAWPTFTRT